MEKKRTVRYPIGEQSFEVLRNRDCLYVDKTRFIETILDSGAKYYFLGRPRRFGKSLFLSTLKCFFQGKRHLFKGLYADTMDWDWSPYPVLHLDLNVGGYYEKEHLRQRLDSLLTEWEREYGIESTAGESGTRFETVIRKIYEKTGKGVVILVDEYDKPLVSNLHRKELFETFRGELYAIYSNFKSSAEYIQLVFLTGVSRFAHLSIFSGLNNINDISFDNLFSGVCGISERELLDNFKEGISALSSKLGYTREGTLADLKRWYDGYRFSSNGDDMYNPYSLLYVMDKEEFRNYWIQSGQATLLMEQLKRFDVNLEEMMKVRCSLNSLEGLDLDNPSPVALLYQTGYLTIKSYNHRAGLYTLGIPNKEVEEGFLSYLLPFYSNIRNNDSMPFIYDLIDDFNDGDVEGFMTRLTSMFSSVSYDMEMNREQNLHNALLILMKLVGLEVETEYRTSQGRIDLFVKTDRYYYIMELKLDSPASEALAQINEHGYALPFAVDGREVIKIGISFSTKTRTISEWVRG